MHTYLIGDILIKWQCDGYRLRPGQYMEQFRYDGPWDGEEITLTGTVAPLEPYTHYPKVAEADIYDIYDVDGERLHLYVWSYLKVGYAVWPDRIAAGRSDAVIFDPAMNRQISMDFDWFFGVCGLHKALLLQGRPILHAACIQYIDKAILFTAPSETGKSTQADLWKQHAGAEILNGDRVLLGRKNGIWHAYGYPCCGSSQICVNRTVPLGAVVVLQQGKENRIEMLSEAAKQRSLVAGMTLYHGDITEIDRAFAAAQSLCEAVPVVKLVCRPDPGAVQTLLTYLRGVWQ